MIKLPGGYAITADEHQYILNKVRVARRTTKYHKAGEEYTAPESYYVSLSGALRGAIRKLQREAVANDEVSTLKEAAAEFMRIHKEVEALAFPGEDEEVREKDDTV